MGRAQMMMVPVLATKSYDNGFSYRRSVGKALGFVGQLQFTNRKDKADVWESQVGIRRNIMESLLLNR